MKTSLALTIAVMLCLQSFSQNKVYIKPNIGITWNNYKNSNNKITGNEDVSNIFWDNDVILELLAGYKFNNNIILESGIIFHTHNNRYHLDYYPELTNAGGESFSLEDVFYCVPLNLKYRFKTKIKNLEIVPYIGLTYSTHKISPSPYQTLHDIEYADNSTIDNLIPQDTTAIIKAYRPNKNALLINSGIGLEYKLFKHLLFTLSGNFTAGFSDINKLDVNVFLKDRTENGEIIYRGNKLYLSCGFIIPIGF